MTVPKSKRNKPKTIYLDRGHTVLADMTKLASPTMGVVLPVRR